MLMIARSDNFGFRINSLTFGGMTVYTIGFGNHTIMVRRPMWRDLIPQKLEEFINRKLWRLDEIWRYEWYGPDKVKRLKLILTGNNHPYFVNTYRVDRCYGGNEEGGWWYDVGEPLESRGADTHEEATALQSSLLASIKQDDTLVRNGHHEFFIPHANRYSMIGGDDIEVYIEEWPAEAFPTERPHYE